MANNEYVGEVATRYDEAYRHMFRKEVLIPTLDVLQDLADWDRVLEFGVGTGRIALPLRERGVEVHGIDLSQDMVRILRSKPGGQEMPVIVGDMTSTQLAESFGLIYLAFNGITNLLTQADQRNCFRNAAAQLHPGGFFVVEAGVPPLRSMPPGQLTVPFIVTTDHVGVDRFDLVRQRFTSHHFWPTGQVYRAIRTHHRYAWPAELDLMADIVGLRLRHRWADWSRTPFTSDSTSHVSVWQSEY